MTDTTSQWLVVDTGPLSHLAKAGWLSVLRSIAGDRPVVIPDAVEAELHEGRHLYPHLQQVLDAEWITVRSLVSPSELHSFSRYSARLVVKDRNLGEAAVLALAETHSGTAVVDDAAARRAARDYSVDHRPTLSLLCEGVRVGLLTARVVADIADHLIESEYRLPFPPGGFLGWAIENGLLSSDSAA